MAIGGDFRAEFTFWGGAGGGNIPSRQVCAVFVMDKNFSVGVNMHTLGHTVRHSIINSMSNTVRL